MTVNSVESYVNQFEGEVRERLETLRHLIKTESPEAVESLSYGLIGYKRMVSRWCILVDFRNILDFMQLQMATRHLPLILLSTSKAKVQYSFHYRSRCP